MIVAGYLGAVSVVTTVKWFWFVIAMGVFVPVSVSPQSFLHLSHGSVGRAHGGRGDLAPTHPRSVAPRTQNYLGGSKSAVCRVFFYWSKNTGNRSEKSVDFACFGKFVNEGQTLGKRIDFSPARSYLYASRLILSISIFGF